MNSDSYMTGLFLCGRTSEIVYVVRLRTSEKLRFGLL
jgi:hypothetical protein